MITGYESGIVKSMTGQCPKKCARLDAPVRKAYHGEQNSRNA